MESLRFWSSPLGRIVLTADGDALTGLWFDDQEHRPDTAECQYGNEELPVFSETGRWLYFDGKEPCFTPKLSPSGTLFRRTVWEILLSVPYGQTVTYGEVAARAAQRLRLPRMSAQAAGGAVGHNPISLIIPCHRVVGADGNLTGYGGGIDRKIRLLRLEGVDTSRLYTPKRSEPR